MTDVAAKAKAAVDEYRALGLPNIHTLERHRELTAELCGLVPALVVEVEKLRSELSSPLADGHPVDTENLGGVDFGGPGSEGR